MRGQLVRGGQGHPQQRRGHAAGGAGHRRPHPPGHPPHRRGGCRGQRLQDVRSVAAWRHVMSCHVMCNVVTV